MFKRDLQARLQRIFGISKTTFNAPSMDAPEQETLFIDIVEVRPRMCNSGSGGRETAKVVGALVAFGRAEAQPFGFFAKRVEQADADDTRNFFFQPEIDVPNSPARLQNLHERRVPFTFLYDSQYDPSRGEMTSIDLSLEMEE